MEKTDCIYQYLGICFQAASKNGDSSFTFGLAELLTAIAILVVAYSITDERYKFRIAVSRIPLLKVFFSATLFVGTGIVMVPLWFEFGLPIPSFANNISYFNAVFAAVFILPLLYWMYVAFLYPPLFKKTNALKFAREVFHTISEGNEVQIRAIASEVGNSADRILECARKRINKPDLMEGGIKSTPTLEAKIANDLILLIGNRRFCKVVAIELPGVAANFFYFASEGGLGQMPLTQFSCNVVDEMFLFTDSVIHYEDDGYHSGLIGYTKPISNEIFGHVGLIEDLTQAGGCPLSGMSLQTTSWGVKSWVTYNRVVLIFMNNYLEKHYAGERFYSVLRIFDTYEHACIDAYQINTMGEDYTDSVEYQKIRLVVSFIESVLDMVEEYKLSGPVKNVYGHNPYISDDIFDQLARIALELMCNISSIDTGEFRNWQIQHNIFWANLLKTGENNRARRIFAYRLQRLIYDEIKEMEEYLDFKNARILSVCLNVMGLSEVREVDRPPAHRALKRLVLRFTKANYLKIVAEQPKVALCCLSGTITFDEKNQRLIKTYRNALSKEPTREFLELDERPE